MNKLHTAVWFQISNNNIPYQMIEHFYLIHKSDPNRSELTKDLGL